MTAIDSPYVSRSAIHHEISTNDVTSHPVDARGGYGTTSIIDDELQRRVEEEREDQQEEQSGLLSERPPGLLIISALGFYAAKKWFF